VRQGRRAARKAASAGHRDPSGVAATGELREPQPLDAPGVASHLDPGTLLIAYPSARRRTVALALESGGDGARGAT
jgi:hypothetical protein